jgi:hypothetical protein
MQSVAWHVLRRVSLAVAVTTLVGCATPVGPWKVAEPVKMPEPHTVGIGDKFQSERGETDYESSYDADSAFVVRPRSAGDPLPPIRLDNVQLNEQSVGDALRLIGDIFRDKGIALVIQGGRRGDADVYGSVTVEGLSGQLSDVLDAISRITGHWYHYNAKSKILTLTPSEHFVFSMPPAVGGDTYTGMVNTMQNLGAHSVYQDPINRTVTFHANRIAFDKIDEFLRHIRDTRVLLIYDVSIYKVALTSNFSAGIAWSQIQNSTGGALVGGQVLSNGLQASFTFTNLGLAQQIIPSLLKQYGRVRSVSNPRISFLSGGWGHFRQGRNTTYVSKVGNNLTTNLNSVTVETSTVNTGTELDLSADMVDDSIVTRVRLKTSDLLKFNPYTALGTQLQLPDTADQEVHTEVRSPIGSAVLLGGIIVSNASGDVGGAPVGGERVLPVSADSTTEDSELVMILRPHVVRFKPKRRTKTDEVPAAAKAEASDASGTRTVPIVVVASSMPPAAVKAPPLSPEPASAPAEARPGASALTLVPPPAARTAPAVRNGDAPPSVDKGGPVPRPALSAPQSNAVVTVPPTPGIVVGQAEGVAKDTVPVKGPSKTLEPKSLVATQPPLKQQSPASMKGDGVPAGSASVIKESPGTNGTPGPAVNSDGQTVPMVPDRELPQRILAPGDSNYYSR